MIKALLKRAAPGLSGLNVPSSQAYVILNVLTMVARVRKGRSAAAPLLSAGTAVAVKIYRATSFTSPMWGHSG